MANIVFAGGGTAGHVMPGLALAAALGDNRRRWGSHKLLWIGAKGRIEQQLAAQANLAFVGLRVRGLVGGGIVNALIALPLFVWATACSVWCLRRFKAQLCVCLGGYASLGPTLAAKLLKIPYIVLEPNAVVSKSSQFVSTAAAARVTYLGAPFGDLPQIAAGYPVRGQFAAVRWDSRQPGSILVTGGSQGARSLNQLICHTLHRHPQLHRFHWTILAGARWHGQLAKSLASLPLASLQVLPFSNKMSSLLAKAQLVISRAGASTIAELATTGCCSLLVPLDTAAGDHQWKNAQVLADRQAALLLPKHPSVDERSDALLQLIQETMGSSARQKQLSETIQHFSCSASCETLLQLLVDTTQPA